MKLSEAMRKGSKMARQCSGWSDGRGGGCALTLAALGAGLRTPESLFDGRLPPFALLDKFPQLYETVVTPCNHGQHSLWHSIMLLNDHGHWSAERIAGWIEATIETPTYSLLDIQHYMKQSDEASGRPETTEVTHV